MTSTINEKFFTHLALTFMAFLPLRIKDEFELTDGDVGEGS